MQKGVLVTLFVNWMDFGTVENCFFLAKLFNNSTWKLHGRYRKLQISIKVQNHAGLLSFCMVVLVIVDFFGVCGDGLLASCWRQEPIARLQLEVEDDKKYIKN